MDVEYVMTTFVDDGLVDIISDGPDSPLAIDESKIVDLNDINAAIEDPGYILEDPSDNTEESEKFTSSYGKRSFTLPVSFFDISSNIKLLTQCRPISISIVDCELYPWYYKKYMQTNIDTNKLYDNEDEQAKELKAFDAQKIEDVLVLKQHHLIKTETSATVQSGFSGIELSPDQRLAVLKLKERIENDIEKTFTYTDNVNKTDSVITINNKEKKTQDQYSNNIPQKDLLAYCKAIAQSIVHNTDHSEPKTKCKINDVEDKKILKTNIFKSDIQPAKEKSSMNNTAIQQENKTKIENANEKVITSPILPCTIKQKKKTESKRNVTKNSRVANPHSENRSNLNNCCDRLTSSVHRVIPHYHNLPLPAASNGYLSQHMDANQMMLHYYSVQRSEIVNTLTQQTMAEMRCLTTNNDQTMNSHHHVPSANYGRELPLIDVEPKSCYNNFSSTFAQNLPLMSSVCQQISRKAVHPVASPQYTNILSPHYTYANALSLNGCSSQIIQNSVNNNAFITGANFGKLHNSMSSEHNTLNYNNSTIVPSQQNQNLVASANPLLSQLLNQSVKPGHMHNNQKHIERNKLLHSNNLQPSSGALSNENINVHQYFYPTLVTNSSKESSSIVGLAFRKENFVPLTKDKSIKIIARKKCKPKDANMNNNVNLSMSTWPSTQSTINRQIDMGASEDMKKFKVGSHSTIPNKISSNNRKARMNTRPLSQNVEIRHYNAATIVQPIEKPVANIQTSHEVHSTGNCYSPAILPIPTFTKSLEMLSSELRKNNDAKLIPNINENQIVNKNQKADLTRKRKHSDKNDVRVKKISLQEYKQRIDSCKVNAIKTVTDNVNIGTNKKNIDNEAIIDGSANVDTLMDLGYDSDTTIILNTTN